MSGFKVNGAHLDYAREVLSNYKQLYWVIGGACSGKSTVCGSISKLTGIPVYDMDAHIFGTYFGQYDSERHPANCAWMSGLDWVLSLSLDEFENLNAAANAEYMDLFAKDMETRSRRDALIVDGGMSFPFILSKTLSCSQIACLSIPAEQSLMVWDQSPERRPMKDSILALSDGEAKWQRFLAHDRRITMRSVLESEQAGIRVFQRNRYRNQENLARAVMRHLGID